MRARDVVAVPNTGRNVGFSHTLKLIIDVIKTFQYKTLW